MFTNCDTCTCDTFCAGVDDHVHRRVQQTASNILHQDDGRVAHFQPLSTVHTGVKQHFEIGISLLK